MENGYGDTDKSATDTANGSDNLDELVIDPIDAEIELISSQLKKLAPAVIALKSFNLIQQSLTNRESSLEEELIDLVSNGRDLAAMVFLDKASTLLQDVGVRTSEQYRLKAKLARREQLKSLDDGDTWELFAKGCDRIADLAEQKNKELP